MQEKTTNPPPPRTQKGAKTLSNPHQCPIPPRGGGGWGFQLTGALYVLYFNCNRYRKRADILKMSHLSFERFS